MTMTHAFWRIATPTPILICAILLENVALRKAETIAAAIRGIASGSRVDRGFLYGVIGAPKLQKSDPLSSYPQ
jgi:hypothetical protein